jgi:hypothetical protein
VSPRSYATPAAFKAALEQRLRAASTTGVDFARRRQLLVLGRYLARIGQVFGRSATLKGGLVLELRLERARTTRDIDLRMVGPSDRVLQRLQEAGRLQLGDFMSFEVQVDPERPEMLSMPLPTQLGHSSIRCLAKTRTHSGIPGLGRGRRCEGRQTRQAV